MNANEAIAELARRQLALEGRITALEAAYKQFGAPGAAGEIDLPAFPDSTNAHVPLPTEQPGYEEPEAPKAMEMIDGQLTFLPPNDTQRKLRTRMANDVIGFEHWTFDGSDSSEKSIPLPKDEAVKAYIQGGPLWLYHYDRSFIMGLGEAIRQAMVADIDSVDAATAQEFGRDILKDVTIGQDVSASIEQDEKWRKAHGDDRGAR